MSANYSGEQAQIHELTTEMFDGSADLNITRGMGSMYVAEREFYAWPAVTEGFGQGDALRSTHRFIGMRIMSGLQVGLTGPGGRTGFHIAPKTGMIEKTVVFGNRPDLKDPRAKTIKGGYWIYESSVTGSDYELVIQELTAGIEYRNTL